jgi:predicted nuclease of predicted toxin-antitoxin system
MRILVDMNLSPAWVDYLGASGFETVHWSQIGARDASDTEVMLWAADQDHVVLTSDLDFGAILASTQARRPSVLQLRSDVLTPAAIGTIVLAAIRQSAPALEEGALISVDAVRARLRVLPFGD